jgi:hypothetical protein
MADIVKSVPDLLIYLVPGFLCLSISQQIFPEHRLTEQSFFLHSLIYSVILIGVFRPVAALVGLDLAKGLGVLALIILSAAIGLVRGKILGSLFWEHLLNRFGISLTAAASVWNRRLSSTGGQWARVYLDAQNIMYDGYIAETSQDPDSTTRELYLKEPKAFRVRDGKLELIEKDLAANPEAGVLINAQLITRIEIIPPIHTTTTKNEH